MTDPVPVPPKPRYRLEIEIYGNTLDEIAHEIAIMHNGGFMLDSNYGKRDSWNIVGGRTTSTMHHDNPDMTPERYEAELDQWWRAGPRASWGQAFKEHDKEKEASDE